ncbi:MAG: glycosyltransferase family 4 protein [Fidelibacterota bacterium]
MKTVLVITYYWPPSGGPGVQRILKFCKYLPACGWRPVVLTVQGGEYPALDPTLEQQVDSAISVYRTRTIEVYRLFRFLSRKETIPTFQLSKDRTGGIFSAFGRWVRLNLVIPDARVGWYFSAVKSGRQIMSREKIDVLFSTGPPHSVHMIGKTLARSGLPWVADFRDPWTDRFYYQENSRARLVSRFDGRLECRVLNQSNAVTTVSPGFRHLLAEKTGERKNVSVIFNGYDEADFADDSIPRPQDETVITHMGTLSKSQVPDALFQAVNKIRNSKGSGYPVRLNLMGPVHPDILEGLDRYDIAGITSRVPYLPHREVLRIAQASSFLFLVIPRTSANKGIIPGKLFEYIRCKVPVLLFGPKDCDGAAIVRDTHSGFTLDYEDTQGVEEILSTKPEVRPEGYEVYSRENQTRRLCRVFDRLSEEW